MTWQHLNSLGVALQLRDRLDISSSQQVNLSNAKSPIDDDWAFCMIIHDIYYQAKIKAFLEKVLTF
jgi:hypothetical protein